VGDDVKNLYMHLELQDRYKSSGQGESIELYKMLNYDKKKKLVINLENDHHHYLYRNLKDHQGKQTELYNMLKDEQKRVFVRGLEIADVKKLYQDIKGQKESTKLYKMLKSEQQDVLFQSLSPLLWIQLRASLAKGQAQKVLRSRCMGGEPPGQQ
jgi:Mg/Co/Ni transporter MgtE